jgi:hypothetical protein
MAVLKSKRTESILSVVAKAEEMVIYTMQAASNERYIPKRLRWCIGGRIVQEAQDVLRLITYANSIKVEYAQDWEMRRTAQKQAMAHTFCLLTEINLCKRAFGHIPLDKMEYWTGMILEVQRLLKAWQKSDAARYGGP